MLIGFVIYVAGLRHLPADPKPRRAPDVLTSSSRAFEAPRTITAGGTVLRRFVLLGAIAATVVLFRATYEQLGNTVPLWIETTDRVIGGSSCR